MALEVVQVEAPHVRLDVLEVGLDVLAAGGAHDGLLGRLDRLRLLVAELDVVAHVLVRTVV